MLGCFKCFHSYLYCIQSQDRTINYVFLMEKRCDSKFLCNSRRTTMPKKQWQLLL